jgi:hypothetical protein
MVLAGELTERHKNQPLDTEDDLNQDTETEEEKLVEVRKVDTGVEGDEEDLLDHDGGVDDGIG